MVKQSKPGLDLDAFGVQTLEASLLLPPISEFETDAAMAAVAEAIVNGGPWSMRTNGNETLELLARCMLALSTELIADPERFFWGYSNVSRGASWTWRTCDVMVLPAAERPANLARIDAMLARLAMSASQRAKLRRTSETLVIGSLATTGRIPLEKLFPGA